jgi:hypothetical protein
LDVVVAATQPRCLGLAGARRGRLVADVVALDDVADVVALDDHEARSAIIRLRCQHPGSFRERADYYIHLDGFAPHHIVWMGLARG